MSREQPPSVEYCMHPSPRYIGSGMGTQLSMHRAVVKQCQKLKLPLPIFLSEINPGVLLGNFHFYLSLPKLKTKCWNSVKPLLKILFFSDSVGGHFAITVTAWNFFENYQLLIENESWPDVVVANDKSSWGRKKVVLKESWSPSICDYSTPHPIRFFPTTADTFREESCQALVLVQKVTKTTWFTLQNFLQSLYRPLPLF